MMRTFAQILYGRAHWVFSAPERPEFAPNIVLVDITDLNPQPQEGWLYDAETGTFSEPPKPVPVKPEGPTLEEMQAQTLLNTEFLVVLAEITHM